MKGLAIEMARLWDIGDVVFLHGELGAGKTTFVRGLLESLGVTEPVRSPTFNLIQIFDTDPPVLHADLYRVKSAEGIGFEDYLESHLLLIEWPDRARALFDEGDVWHVHIEFTEVGRSVTFTPPASKR